MKRVNPQILVINSGSSSLKFALFESDPELHPMMEGKIERIGLPDATFRMTGVHPSEHVSKSLNVPNHKAAVNVLIDWFKTSHHSNIIGIGHRVVHGGPNYSKPQPITSDLIDELHRLSPFAPQHLPQAIILIQAFQNWLPDISHIACFDTAFHHDLPRIAQILPIPRRYEAQGIRRYGFHGLSYEFIMKELERSGDPAAKKGRVILAHLGHGASLAAVKDGKSIDTSMGFTPTAGLPMSTRSGDLDPGVLLYLSKTEHLSTKQLNDIVNLKSGLLGISETSSDLRDLLECETYDVRAAEAIALFCYQIKKWIGAFSAVLNGLDTLVFSGGIGENAHIIRERICDDLDFLGVRLDSAYNNAQAPIISKADSRVTVRVIRTNEECMIANLVYLQLGIV
ncbi:MAG: acetate/propionate family kinase [Legionellaceae bacterium]|nr:acetate/propionate family kinase [Legionellaceae bacterium]